MNIRLIFFHEIMKGGKNLQTCRQPLNKVFLHHMSTNKQSSISIDVSLRMRYEWQPLRDIRQINVS